MLLWDAWKAYAHRAAGYQTRVLLVVVYWVVLGPGALIGRLFSSRLLDLNPGLGKARGWRVDPTSQRLRPCGASSSLKKLEHPRAIWLLPRRRRLPTA